MSNEDLGGPKNEYFVLLRDSPQYKRTVLDWYANQWGKDFSDMYRNDEVNNSIWVLTLNDTPIACAGLFKNDMTSHPEFKPWLGGVYVHKDYRNQGYGIRMVSYVEMVATLRGIKQLWLYTYASINFYLKKFSYEIVSCEIYDGEAVVVMTKRLSK